jgi:hypothetical protein
VVTGRSGTYEPTPSPQLAEQPRWRFSQYCAGALFDSCGLARKLGRSGERESTGVPWPVRQTLAFGEDWSWTTLAASVAATLTRVKVSEILQMISRDGWQLDRQGVATASSSIRSSLAW